MLLIVGHKGQLGTELCHRLPEAVCVDQDELDIRDAAAVRAFVDKNRIKTIINCAAYTAVDKAEDDPELVAAVNCEGPRNLAATGAQLIHISTDYVFDGSHCHPYLETDETHPLSVYGQTKRAGEKAVLETAETAVIIRTAWLYSPYGSNFVKTMRRLGAEKDHLGVVADQIGTPTYAADLADAIVRILPQLSPQVSGIYHYTNEGVCSWYDLAVETMKACRLPCQVEPIRTEDYPTRAIRPAYSVLSKTKIRQVFGVKTPHWREALLRCCREMERQ